MSKEKLPPPPHRPVPASQCYLAYGTALLAGMIAWWALYARFPLMDNVFWMGLLVTCLCTIVIWIFSIANGNSSIYDPYWVFAPPLLALGFKATSGGGLLGPWHLRQVCIFA